MKLRIAVICVLLVAALSVVASYLYVMKDRAVAETEKETIVENLPEEKEEVPKVELVKYEGPVHHIFFHSLIAYDELAFDGDSRAEGYNYWMTTVSEFEAMLPELLDRGYVLYDIEELVEIDSETGEMRKKEIYLPEGKKPLVLSVDDVNYYEYMKTDGFATKLVLDENGEVANEIKTPEGDVIVSRRADVMPILDDFVKAHPEFSHNGAKGILALTGYQGALGYRVTDLTGEELNLAIAEATKVANKLKETGWRFACHSYTHNQYFKNYTVTMAQLKHDNERWKKYIQPITGETNIYISPFGVRFKRTDERYRYLVEEGFSIFCPVQKTPELSFEKDNVIMTRFNLDGYSMAKRKEYVKETYFDVDKVYDSNRPELK
ncbi:MAG: hypothetical protein J6M02_06510 [Clostridia bacterium]|nr:hypothetical protein [Clostridia bacterium]